MELIKIYLDTSAVNSFLFGSEKEPKRFEKVQQIFDLLKQEKIRVAVSFYTLVEIYWFCMDNFPADIAGEMARKAIYEILSYKIELIPMLRRAERLKLSPIISMTDSSDLPHAMMAYVYECDYLVAYDSHFEEIADIIKFLTPDALLHVLN